MKKQKMLKLTAFTSEPSIENSFSAPAGYTGEISVVFKGNNVSIHGFDGSAWSMIYTWSNQDSQHKFENTYEKYFIKSLTGQEESVYVSFFSTGHYVASKPRLAGITGGSKLHDIEEVPVYTPGDVGKLLTVMSNGSLAWLLANESIVVAREPGAGNWNYGESTIVGLEDMAVNGIVSRLAAQGNNINNPEFTVSFWFKDNEPGVGTDFFVYRQINSNNVDVRNLKINSDGRIVAGLFTGSLQSFYLTTTDRMTSHNINMFDGQWHHVYLSFKKFSTEPSEQTSSNGSVKYNVCIDDVYYEAGYLATNVTPDTHGTLDLIIPNSTRFTIESLQLSNEFRPTIQQAQKIYAGGVGGSTTLQQASLNYTEDSSGLIYEVPYSFANDVGVAATINEDGTFPSMNLKSTKYLPVGLGVDEGKSYSYWFNKTSTNASTMLIASGGGPGGNNAWGIIIHPTVVRVVERIFSSSSNWQQKNAGWTLPQNVADGQWHNIIFYFTRDNITAYFNGVKLGSIANSAPNAQRYWYNGSIGIGTGYYEETMYAPGSRSTGPATYKNVRMFSGPMTDQAALNIYNGDALDYVTPSEPVIQQPQAPAGNASGLEDLSALQLLGGATMNNGVLSLSADGDAATLSHSESYEIREAKTISMWMKRDPFTGSTTSLLGKTLVNKAIVYSATSFEGWSLHLLKDQNTSTNVTNYLKNNGWHNNGMLRWIASNTASTHGIDSSSFWKLPYPIDDGEWHHIVFQIDNVAIGIQPKSRMFVDGNLLTEGVSCSNNGSTIVQIGADGWLTNRFYVGQSTSARDLQFGRLMQAGEVPTGFFGGDLDGVNIDSGIMTEVEISGLYAAGR